MSVKKIARIDGTFPDTLSLTWVINNICSNSCSYCHPSLWNGKNHHYEWANAKKFIQRLIKEYPSIHCNISGGEPTMSPFFLELCKLMTDNGNTVGITSNGVRTTRYFEELSKYLLYCVFSYHPEYGDNNKLLEKCKAIKDRTRCSISIMMHPKYWEQSVEYFYKVADTPYVGANPVRINYRHQKDKSTYTYTDKQLEWFSEISNYEQKWDSSLKYGIEKTGMRVTHTDGTVTGNKATTHKYITSGQINFKGWKCHTGSEAMYIGWNGKIYGSNCAIGEPFGHINEPDKVVIDKNPVICDGRRCDCSPDYKITKYPANINESI